MWSVDGRELSILVLEYMIQRALEGQEGGLETGIIFGGEGAKETWSRLSRI